MLPLSLVATLAAGSIGSIGPFPQAGEAPAWPCRRGPNHDGVSLETDWSPIGASEPLWRRNVGLGYSNVTLAKDRLYTIGHDPEAGTDSVVCLDAVSGEELWRHTYAAETMANFHGGGSLTTPTLHGGLVYVLSRQGLGLCLDASTGAVLWQHDYAKELELAPSMYGFAASPLVHETVHETVHGAQLVLALGGTIVAVEKDDGGTLRWRTEPQGEGGYATPVPMRLGERDCLAVFSGPGLLVLDAETGKELHRHPFQGKAGTVNAGSPIVRGNRVFVSAAYDAGAALVELGGAPEPTVVWASRSMRNKVSGCTLWQGYVYGFDEALLKCISFEDGTEKWRVRGLGMGAVAVAGGRLVVITSRGELIVAEATPEEFRELSRKKVLDGGVFWTTPVLLGGLIYCRSSLGDLVCLDHRAAPAPAARPIAEAAAGAAAPEEAPGELPAAEALFAAHAAGIGADALRGRKSVRLAGSFENAAAGITRCRFTIDWEAPGRWKLAYDLGELGDVERCYDGEIGWQLDPFYGNHLYEGDALRELRETRAFHAAADWKAAYATMRTLGRERFGGRDAWVVEVTTEAGSRRKVYFDVETGLRAGRAADAEAMVIEADYRDFGGVRMPARVTFLVPDTGEEEVFEIEEATWDAVAEGAFARSPAVLKLLRTPEEIAADARRLRELYAAYLGKYQTDEGPLAEYAYAIEVEDGELALGITGMSSMALAEPDEEGRFYFPTTEMYLSFELDEGGAVTAMVMHGAPGMPEEVVVPRREE